MKQNNRISCYIGLLCLISIVLACGDSTEKQPLQPQVNLAISPDISIETSRVYGNSLLHATYRWKTGTTFLPPDGSLMAKVHFTDDKGNILIQDDHSLLLQGIKDWKPDQTYDYKRIVYIPLIPRITKLDILIGVYQPDDDTRFFLEATPAVRDKYKVGEITVYPPRNPEDLPEAKIEFGEGWHNAEFNTADKSKWRWMAGKAVCRLKNPHRNAELFLRGWIPTEDLGQPSNITILINGEPFRTYENYKGNFDILESISQSMFNDQDMIELTIETDKTYVPAEIGKNDDQRRLGIMVRIMYFN
ncbi:hypothetical protein JW979_00945 [bacterium]|nr:hypothetical protein [candidate division CSSED10-310 bacterium]